MKVTNDRAEDVRVGFEVLAAVGGARFGQVLLDLLADREEMLALLKDIDAQDLDWEFGTDLNGRIKAILAAAEGKP